MVHVPRVLVTVVAGVLFAGPGSGRTLGWGIAVHADPSTKSRLEAFVSDNGQRVRVEEFREGWIRVDYPRKGLSGWIRDEHLIEALEHLPLTDESGHTRALDRSGERIVVVSAGRARTRVRVADGGTGELPFDFRSVVRWASPSSGLAECRPSDEAGRRPWQAVCTIANPVHRVILEGIVGESGREARSEQATGPAVALEYRVLPAAPSPRDAGEATGLLTISTGFVVLDEEADRARVRVREGRDAELPISRMALVWLLGRGHFTGASVVGYEKRGDAFVASGPLPVRSDAAVTSISGEWTSLRTGDRETWIQTDLRALFEQ